MASPAASAEASGLPAPTRAEGGEAASKLLPGAFSKVSERFAKPRVGTV